MTTTLDARGGTTSAPPETLRNFIGGRWVDATGAELLDVPNPATEELLARVPLSTADHVAAAARAAREAFREWSEVPVPERVKVLYTFREAFLDNRDALVRQVTLENGKITSDAAGEYRRALEVVEFAIGMPTLMAGYNVESVSRGIDTMMERYPVGVTAAITPFNFPLMVPLWTLPIAIAAGNAYILKPSERTPHVRGPPRGAARRGRPAARRLQPRPRRGRRGPGDLRRARDRRRLVRRLGARRTDRLRGVRPVRQARPGARRREEPHRRHARRGREAVASTTSPNRRSGTRASAASRARC